eukprot:symbB.v1.2.010111.t4/scaffold658.1/size175746/1
MVRITTAPAVSRRRCAWGRRRCGAAGKAAEPSQWESEGFPIVVVRIHPGSSDAMLRRPLWWVARSPSAMHLWFLADETFDSEGEKLRSRLGRS